MKTLILLSLLLMGVLWVNQIEPQVVEVTRIVEKPIIVERIIEKVELIYVDRYIVTTAHPSATKDELDRAYRAIDYGMSSHQFYATNLFLQTQQTGDTKFNEEWIGNYRLFQELLERAYGKWIITQ